MSWSWQSGSLLSVSMPKWTVDIHAPISIWTMPSVPGSWHRDLSLGRVAKCQVSANMKKIRITARAASFLSAWAKSYEPQIGPGYVPVITWTVKDSANPNLVPYLGLAFEKPDVVDRSRIMECEGKDVEIFQYVPDELLEEAGPKYIDVRNNRLVLAREALKAGD
jgi:hypothetical protein